MLLMWLLRYQMKSYLTKLLAEAVVANVNMLVQDARPTFAAQDAIAK
ncbi:MAG TPA: hypothetical protein VN176_13220 [Verrucomicrobiae bacterium]|jgi:hypothetical protein|nr:hypothetical protein [Verrucomicrobiae bacterium]